MNTKFRSNVEAKTLTKLIDLRIVKAESWAKVLSATGLSHSKAELAIMEHEAAEAKFSVVPLTPAFVKYGRTVLGLGWGPIMVWTQSSEGAVRKAWAEATNTHSDGQRVNHGGRFKFDEPDLYVGELKPTGTAIPKTKPLTREQGRDAAITQRLMKAEMSELRTLAESFGIELKKGTTKAKLVIEIRKANATKVAEKKTA